MMMITLCCRYRAVSDTVNHVAYECRISFRLVEAIHSEVSADGIVSERDDVR